ncbi:MAG: GNAT family N-acetyltransferase [Akkermansiaceae bacterium]
MSWGDVRGLLQYVPQFRGKVFLVVVDSPVSALAEVMLNLVSLQNIGVQLVLGSTVHKYDVIIDLAIEAELKCDHAAAGLGDRSAYVCESLARGQAIIMDLEKQDSMSLDLAVFAHEIGASKLIVLKPGAQEDLIQGAVRAADLQSMSNDQPAILQAAAKACQLGISRVHILDGSDPETLLSELFSNEGAGTMVYADSYRLIRPLREEDIVELLGMIGRSVRNTCLVPRDYADIETHLEDYSVMEIDGNVVGSVALLSYPDSDTAEIACLYVKQSHEGLGYGVELVRHAEQRADECGATSVFALTNRAAGFFQDKLGYSEWPLEDIPLLRRDQLDMSGRDSRVFGRSLK